MNQNKCGKFDKFYNSLFTAGFNNLKHEDNTDSANCASYTDNKNNIDTIAQKAICLYLQQNNDLVKDMVRNMILTDNSLIRDMISKELNTQSNKCAMSSIMYSAAKEVMQKYIDDRFKTTK